MQTKSSKNAKKQVKRKPSRLVWKGKRLAAKPAHKRDAEPLPAPPPDLTPPKKKAKPNPFASNRIALGIRGYCGHLHNVARELEHAAHDLEKMNIITRARAGRGMSMMNPTYLFERRNEMVQRMIAEARACRVLAGLADSLVLGTTDVFIGELMDYLNSESR